MNVKTELITFNTGMALENGHKLDSFELMVESYGKLNKTKTNAILVCHAFSGNHHASGKNKVNEIGWWDEIIGPNKAIDTNKYYVVCCNNLGGCSGSSGPKSINPSSISSSDQRLPTLEKPSFKSKSASTKPRKLFAYGERVMVKLLAVNKSTSTFIAPSKFGSPCAI